MFIRLCPLANSEFPQADSKLYIRRKCGYCKSIVMDRQDVGEDDPPPACPKCQAKWYQGKLGGKK